MKGFILIFLFFITGFVFCQNTKQYNTTGSDLSADVPWQIVLNPDDSVHQSLPLSFYIYGSSCFGCNNELAYIDIKIKNASVSSFDSLISFSGYSESDFLSLFQDFSINDNSFSVQDFIASKPGSSNLHSVIFTADTNFWVPPVLNVDIVKDYFYFTMLIPYEKYSIFGNCFDIEITFGLDLEADQKQYFRVFVKNESLPKLSGWYRGDTHYHGMYTQNSAEYGLPLSMTRNAAKILGMDWLIFTDHSCDYDNYGTGMQDNWFRQGQEISEFNTLDSSLLLIRGIELSVNNSNGNIVHALAYPDPMNPFDMPFIADGGGDLNETQLNLNMVFDSLNKYNGFCFAAHPFAELDALSAVIDGGSWNLSDTLFPENGSNHPSFGTVVSNSLTSFSDVFTNMDSMLINPCLAGGQLWNLMNTLSATDEVFNPWNVMYSSSISGFQFLSSADPIHHDYRLRQNLDVYKAILQRGLIFKNSNPAAINWKFFMEAGSDAHGSFNYSNTDMTGGITGNINDNTLGKLSSLVYCPDGMGFNGKNVLSALKNGNIILSSGPILNITLVKNNSQYYIPGNDADLSEYSGEIVVRLNSKTNSDFGNIASVSLIYGSESGEVEINLPVFTGEHDFLLSELLQQANVVPEPGKYFYLRCDMQTVRIYSYSESLLYKKNFEFFRSMTNPIWIKPGNITDINSFYNSGIIVYPNPAKNLLNVHLKDFSGSVICEISDITGKVLITTQPELKDKFCFNIEMLGSGLYFIKIRGERFTAINKFYKN